MASEQQVAQSEVRHSFLDSSFPVLLPELPELRLPSADFEAYIHRTLNSQPSQWTDALRVDLKAAVPGSADHGKTPTETGRTPFMDGLLSRPNTMPSLDKRDGKMLTENGDVSYSTSGNVLVDLFSELERVVSADRLKVLLEAAWKEDPEATLRLIWNARSIHLGKSDKITFYRAAGWLAQNHPETFLTNLEWLVRPVIQKKAPKSNVDKPDAVAGADDAFEIIDADFKPDESETPKKRRKVGLDHEPDAGLPGFQIKYGLSHGYWKDLLNILALAARRKLVVSVTEEDIHCVLQDDSGDWKQKKLRDWTADRKKTLAKDRHEDVMARLEGDQFYRALHVTVARLFADQLKLDIARINGSKEVKASVSLCAKWAPTSKKSHDRHTFIVSSVAELLHPFDEVCPSNVDPADRTTYLKYARRAYQVSTLSKLRKHLDIVERPISEARFNDIKYERVPSLAMNQYTSLFIKKDQEHFEQYIDKVAAGKTRISGATLLPSTLVGQVRGSTIAGRHGASLTGSNFASRMAERKSQIELQITDKATNGQWNTLYQRIKDSGKLESSIAVCDVSGSMGSPTFKDGTCPMDSAIGLSLLLAEVTKPPFGGAFINFSADPQIVLVGGPDDARSFKEKVNYIERSNWSTNTNFVAVFENLLLPMALENNLKPEDMVKQIFVFSDMQFDAAESSMPYRTGNYRHEGATVRWSTSFERIKKKFNDAGYELPRLVFWNLAGGRDGGAAPKPVTATEKNTALVSGYSQGQLKMFLENGSFEDDPEEVIEKDEDGAVVVDKKKSMDPVAVMQKAISHEAYRMLQVID